jgi:hypothetical protein
MKGRVATIFAVAVVTGFSLSIGRATAGSDRVSCLSKTMPVTNTSGDGTECQTMVFGAGPNKASAKASTLGFAQARAGNGSTIIATASNQGQAVANAAAALGSVTASGSGSIASLNVDLVGGGKVIAKGANSVARSHISSANGGLANSDASRGSTAIADVLSTGALMPFGNGGSAVANASKGSTATAVVQMAGGGKAKATSSGSGAAAESVVEEVCKAESTAKGADSIASAVCENPSSVVTANATKGSTAVGSDINPPICTPMNGGIAKVRSPMGNCG